MRLVAGLTLGILAYAAAAHAGGHTEREHADEDVDERLGEIAEPDEPFEALLHALA